MSVFDFFIGPFAFGRFLDRSTIEKETTEFYADKTGNRIANVPYQEYISAMKEPNSSVIPEGIFEGNAAEINSAAIQKVIDSFGEGGGTVFIPEGRYFITTIHLKSNVTLFLSEKSELISISCEDNEKSPSPLKKGLIMAENVKNISIVGGGKINGNGLTYTEEPENGAPLFALKKFNTYLRTIEARKRIRFSKKTERSHILYFKNCAGIRLNNIFLTDSAFWTVRFDNCFDVQVKDFIIDSHIHIANSDGIDICGGKNYEISNCFIACADDAICIKSIEYPVENVNVSDCVLSSCANCFKIGTETQFDISNVNLKSCKFFMPDGFTYGYSGVAIESCDGADLKNISISDIEMNGISSPFLLWLGNRFRYNRKAVGSLENITIKNVKAHNVEMPSAIVGCINKKKVHYIKNITVENLTATYRDTEEQLNIRRKIGEYTMSGYPDITRVSHMYMKSHEKSKYWDLPCYGICVKHAEKAEFKNIKIIPRSCNRRKEYYLYDVK